MHGGDGGGVDLEWGAQPGAGVSTVAWRALGEMHLAGPQGCAPELRTGVVWSPTRTTKPTAGRAAPTVTWPVRCLM